MTLALVFCIASAGLYNSGVVLQSSVAFGSSQSEVLRPSLIAALARAPTWLAGTALNVVGWIFYVAALTRASLTFVQPVIGVGVFFLLGFAWLVLGTRPRRMDWLGGAALVAGVALLSRSAPRQGTLRVHPAAWIVAIAILAVAAAAPYAMRKHRSPVALAASAGFAYAVTGIGSEVVSRGLKSHTLSVAAAGAVVTGVFALVGFLSEMSGLVSGSVTVVVPVMLLLDTVIPVALAPLLFGEHWPHASRAVAALIAGIVLAVSGTITLGISPAVQVVSRARTKAER